MRTTPTPFTARHRPGFTIIEVMMASVILVVGFMGMIQAITICSELLDVAQKQTIAANIIQTEMDNLRLGTWATIQSLPSPRTPTTNDPSGNVSITVDQNGNVSSSDTSTYPNDRNFFALTSDPVLSNAAKGFTCVMAVTDPKGSSANLRQITITVTWVKSGTLSAASASSGSWLDQLSFYRASPIRRTYSRSGTGYFGKYGLCLNLSRS